MRSRGSNRSPAALVELGRGKQSLVGRRGSLDDARPSTQVWDFYPECVKSSLGIRPTCKVGWPTPVILIAQTYDRT